MVTINLTLIVNLVLFLLFMWGMHLFVFKPLLDVMDRRETKIQEDRKAAENLDNQAKELEQQYLAEMGAMHREASRMLVRAHRAAQEAHQERLEEKKLQYHRELAELRRHVREAIAADRATHPELASSLVMLMAERIEQGNSIS